MHRLSRQFVCPNRISRALRPSGSSVASPSIWGRRYASSAAPKRTQDKFDRLFASLRPNMKEDELAMTIAAMVLSTQNPKRLETLEATIPEYLKGFDRTSLHKKVNHYIENPPRDNFDSLAAPSMEIPAEKSEETIHTLLPSELVEYDPTLPSPLDQLAEHLAASNVREAIDNMEREDMAELNGLLEEASLDSNSMAPLDRIAAVLSKHGVGIKYYNLPVEEGMEKSGIVATERNEEEIGMDAEDLAELEQLRNEERESVRMAKRAAEDVSFAPLTPRRVRQNDPYPDLMTPDPLMDSRDVQEFPPEKGNPYHNRVIIRNHTSMFNELLDEAGHEFNMDEYKPTQTDETEESSSSQENLPLSLQQLHDLYRFPLIRRRVTQQTGKGKIHRQYVLMVVGNGDGLVGYGQGKDDDGIRAEAKAYAQAVRNMDWVERFEKRTIWTDMDSKLGATQVIMRPRPVGFGLRCNPNLHQVLKAAGIKDISAKVWGSRNPINVIKAAFRMLQAGHAPLAMGDGIGGPGRKLNKGSGLRSKSDVERERGRQLIGLRK